MCMLMRLGRTHLACVDEAEIAQLGVAIGVEEHIVRFEVSVNDRRPP